MIGWFLTTRLGRSLAWVLAGAVAFIGIFIQLRAKARHDARAEAKERDVKGADLVRKRADAARADADRELDAAAFLRKHNRLRDE